MQPQDTKPFIFTFIKRAGCTKDSVRLGGVRGASGKELLLELDSSDRGTEEELVRMCGHFVAFLLSFLLSDTDR